MNRYLTPLLTLSLLAGCSVKGPDYVLPDSAMSKQAQAQATFALNNAKALQASQALNQQWWQSYQDPVLDDLIEQALSHNTTLRVAYHSLRQAYEGQVMAENANAVIYSSHASAGRGQLSSEALALHEKLPVMNLLDAGVGVSYQVDLFGKLKRATEAATANTQAQQALLANTRLTIIAQVVHQYLQSCHAGHELHIAEQSLAITRDQAQVVERLFSGGRENAVNVARAQANVKQTEALLPPLESRKAVALYQLATLLGRTPTDISNQIKTCSHAPVLSQPIPVGDGASLIKRRPDITQAERELAAATAQIGVAVAELYPEVTLGAHFGYTGMVEHTPQAITNTWGLMPSIKWHIPTEVDRARIRAREAGADLALAKFDGIVLNALRETQTAITHYEHLLTRRQALFSAVEAAQRASEDNRRLYQEGRLNYQESLITDRDLIQNQAALADCEAQIAAAQVQLFLALGGGWEGLSEAVIN